MEVVLAGGVRRRELVRDQVQVARERSERRLERVVRSEQREVLAPGAVEQHEERALALGDVEADAVRAAHLEEHAVVHDAQVLVPQPRARHAVAIGLRALYTASIHVYVFTDQYISCFALSIWSIIKNIMIYNTTNMIVEVESTSTVYLHFLWFDLILAFAFDVHLVGSVAII